MRRIIFIVMIVLIALPLQVQAKYPSRAITIIVPSAAGGSTDATARIFIKAAKNYWPEADFVVKNVSGSGGQKGFEEIARAKADGYTIGMVFTTQVVAHIVSKRAKYTLDSFHVMGNVGQDPEIVVVPKNSSITSLDELVKAAKEKTLTATVNGIGSDDFVAMRKFEEIAGVTFNMMPTKGSTEQKAAILGGHVDVSFMNLSQMHGQHKAGDARIIAILDETRSDLVMDVKTGIEQGYKVLMTAARGFVAPAKIDKDVADKLDDLLQKVLKDPGFIADCKKDSLFLLPMTGTQFLGYLKELQIDTQRYYNKNPW
ncbi:MAG: tripartite tricarboxylate transporter substrate binding protein [Deltaproteobacteria bacterium]|nr:tripartite tricarboxylate transporter substrate binding protein [Deltaproteobacteria bacterium]